MVLCEWAQPLAPTKQSKRLTNTTTNIKKIFRPFVEHSLKTNFTSNSIFDHVLKSCRMEVRLPTRFAQKVPLIKLRSLFILCRRSPFLRLEDLALMMFAGGKPSWGLVGFTDKPHLVVQVECKASLDPWLTHNQLLKHSSNIGSYLYASWLPKSTFTSTINTSYVATFFRI